MRKKQLIKYCSEIEDRNLKLRREIDETKRGADEMAKALDAILAEIVKNYGEITIDLPKVGNTVSVRKEDEKLIISANERKDAQGPYSCGEENVGDEQIRYACDTEA